MYNAERWASLSYAQQMGNIASELLRASNQTGEAAKNHLQTTLELLELSMLNPRYLSETTRLRELVAQNYLGESDSSAKQISDYCLSFL